MIPMGDGASDPIRLLDVRPKHSAIAPAAPTLTAAVSGGNSATAATAATATSATTTSAATAASQSSAPPGGYTASQTHVSSASPSSGAGACLLVC
jgi:hypothetical protein